MSLCSAYVKDSSCDCWLRSIPWKFWWKRSLKCVGTVLFSGLVSSDCVSVLHSSVLQMFFSSYHCLGKGGCLLTEASNGPEVLLVPKQLHLSTLFLKIVSSIGT